MSLTASMGCLSLTLAGLIFGELSSDLVKLGSISQLREGFFLFGVFLTLIVKYQIVYLVISQGLWFTGQ